MTTSYDSRLGTSPEEGTKAPCVVITDAEITLAGEQTINSVSVVAGHRVLVGHQSDTTQNGIYVAAVGQWARATDFNLAEDVTTGVLIPTPTGLYKAVFSGSFVPGTTGVAIEEYLFTTPSTPTVTENQKIAVLGASETVFPWSKTWVDQTRNGLQSEYINVDVFHTGAGAINHDIALNTPDTLTGQTRVELTNQVGADVIIVELGLNDAILGVGNLEQEEMIADAQALYVNLRANNPDAVICYSRLVPYDEDQHGALPVTSIKKKYCVPFMHEHSTKSGEANHWTSEYDVLNQVLSSTMQDRLENWRALDAEIQAMSEVDVVIDTNYFRPARLGLVSHDRVHPNGPGHNFIQSAVWGQLQTNSTIRNKITELQKIRDLGDFTEFDNVWNSAVKADADGDGYELKENWPDSIYQYPRWINIDGNTGLIAHAAYWGNQQRAAWDVSDRVNRDIDQSFDVIATGLWPKAEIQTRVWLDGDAEPTTWNADTPAKKTSAAGSHIGNDRPTWAAGDYLIKYKVGNDIFGPFPIALSGAYSTGGSSGSKEATFIRTTNAVTITSNWTDVALNSEVDNDTGGAVSLNTSTGEMSVADDAGVSKFRLTCFCTIDALVNGVNTLSYKRNGVTQHNRMAGNMVIDDTSGAAWPLIQFSTIWLPITPGGESLFMQVFTPTSTQLQAAYGIVAQIEVK
ncbi:MAG: hypothetical protein JAY90_20305 [Candidatus Thiodiazotropha lotti]|nr:hypothetical protein [Candidatus Thiodiazotropha lotti]